MRSFRISQCLLCILLIFGLSNCEAAVGTGNSTHVTTVSRNGQLKKDSGSGVIGPSESRRVAKDFLKQFNRTMESPSSNSTSNLKQKISPQALPGVQIIESGSRSRGEARVLRRGSSPAFESRFSLRNPLNRQKQRNGGGEGYGSGTSSLASSTSVDTLGSFQVISIPGNNIPPPIYSYDTSPALPPSVIIAGAPGGSSSGNSYGNAYGSSYKPGGGGTGGGGGFATSTSRPDIIIPPEVVTPPGPGPTPIGPPGPGTSVPIIGGGGGDGGDGDGDVLPPSPPPDEIFPPTPPPDDDEDDFLIGRRLEVDSSRGGAGKGVRTRTRARPSSVPSSRHSIKDVISSSGSRERSGLGGNVRRERLRDKVTFVEEVEEPLSVEISADDPNIITDFVFSDIKCFKTRQNEYFGATIHMKSGFHLPYIRDRPQDPLSSEECRLDPVEGTRGSYHMAVTDLRGCGVEQCGESMCLTMVFPRVPILALADDEVTTIKCIPQKSTISDTKSISFAGDTTDNRRSSSTVEGGIQEFVAEVGVFRQNPGSTNGLYVKRVNSGGVVQLGEPLQLRSVVRGTDGWKHSRLTDVKVWRMRDNLKQNLDNLDPNQASEVITLVDAHGCRNDEYIVIANEHPIRDPRNDMVHHFTFKAFLFRGQRVNEPLIVTARVHACQELQDCVMECEGTRRRVKRSPVELHNASSIVHDFDSQLALRVVGLKDHPSSILDDGQFPFDYSYQSSKAPNKTELEHGSMSCNEKMFASGFAGGCIMLLICGLALALYTYVKQGRIHYSRNKTSSSSPRRGGGGAAYRYPPPPGRLMPSGNAGGPPPYQKPLPPPPTESQPPVQSPPTATSASTPPNSDGKTMSEMSQVAKLLQELAKNNNNNEASGKQSRASVKSSSKTEPKKKADQPSAEYACIDETNYPGSSSSSSEIDLTKVNKKGKDGVYILYCYNKDKKNKLMLPLSAPSSMRMRRKHLKGRNDLEDNDDDDEGDFICQDEDSEAIASQTEEVTESDDSYEEMKSNGKGSGNNSSKSGNNNNTGNITKNQACRRTVREVKKKSKQNNSIAYSGGGIIRRRVSSVYREGYLNGIRGAVTAAVSKGGGGGGSFPLRYRKSPSTGNIPAATDGDDPIDYRKASSGKRIHFSVRERRSARRRRQLHQQQRHYDQYSTSEGMLSEATTVGSDLDSAYSGSNCSKLTEDQLYELKHGGGRASGRYPDFHNFHKQQNLVDVQRQLRRSGAQGQHQQQKQEVRRTSSSPNNTTNVEIGLGSPPLSLGETKATHFVTRDDSTTKILIVPETHV